MNRSRTILIGATAVAVFIFAYSIWGETLLPRAVVEHFHAGGTVAGASLDRTITFKYGTPIVVAAVVDGDTLQLINGEYVRLNGIDTPEEVDPRKGVQCYAAEAAARTRELAEGQVVTVLQDVSYTDKYGRWVGLVYLPDGRVLNDILVSEGYAFAYKYQPDIAHADVFKTEEINAHAAGLGLWSHCTVFKTSSGRKQTNDL